MKNWIVLGLLASSAMAEPSIVPQPLELKETGGGFALQPNAAILYADAAAKNPAEMLAASLRPATGFKLPVKPGTQGTIVFRTTEDSKLGSEGYALRVTDHVSITAPTEQGIFYGAQTLRQLLPIEIFSPKKVSAEWPIPGVEIRDVPRFGWRGMHLDVGRHFFAVDDIKKFIDMLAIHKLNTFHWHLTEDQGWRVEIKKYPKLTTVGAYRKSTPPYGNRGGSDGKRYGGFYT